MQIQDLLALLQQEKMTSWSDLGLFLDRLKAKQVAKPIRFNGILSDFKQTLKRGIGFITFHYGIYGVTVEMMKYAQVLEKIIPDARLHFIAGKIPPEATALLGKESRQCEIPILQGFGDWGLFNEFFKQELIPNTPHAQQLLQRFWQETLQIVEQLGQYIEENDIQLLYLLNICSNPGNVSLSLATVLLSEYLQIPVINNNHEFYWEGGHSSQEIKQKSLKRGPRDFFFTNAHISEFFTIIEQLYPWESQYWFNLNINYNQTYHLIKQQGHNPIRVSEIGTAIDTNQFVIRSKRATLYAQGQVEAMFKHYGTKLYLQTPTRILEKKLIDFRQPKPVLVGASVRLKPNLASNNIILLQPTRVMLRKRIEIAFWLLHLLFQTPSFIAKFEENPLLKITVLVSGAVPIAHIDYFNKLLREFDNLLQTLPSTFKNRLFLGFLFSEIDTPRFKQQFEQPIDMAQLYNIASLVTLPSETEGRGLPIIEATACGLSIFCRRYYPETAYAEVIGEHLSKKERLKVIEFNGKDIPKSMVNEIIDRIFFPQNYIAEVVHNQQVVAERYSLDALQRNLAVIIHKLCWQLQSFTPFLEQTQQLLTKYVALCDLKDKPVNNLIDVEHRNYLAGYGKLGQTLMLKSLMSTGYFRKEMALNKGRAMDFALRVLKETPLAKPLTRQQRYEFFSLIEAAFQYNKENTSILNDATYGYYQQNNRHYPYQQLTYQELTGYINYVYHRIATTRHPKRLTQSPPFFTDLNLALFQLTNSSTLKIDNREELLKRLQTNVPIAYFPGGYIKYELEFFVLQPIRSRLKLKPTEPLTKSLLQKHYKSLQPVFIFCLKHPIRRWLTAKTLQYFFDSGEDQELSLLIHYGICQIVESEQWTVGVHLAQQGKVALEKLQYVQDNNGFIIANGEHAAIMTDIIAIDCFHIGKAVKEQTAQIMGIPQNSGFIQFVPAGIRPTLGYPAPVQMAKDFHDLRRHRLYRDIVRHKGEAMILDALQKDAKQYGTPLRNWLENYKDNQKRKRKPIIRYHHFTNRHEDGQAYEGSFICLHTDHWHFEVQSHHPIHQNMRTTVEDYNTKQRHKVRLAWSGDFGISNAMIKRHQLPEGYEGLPLSFVLQEEQILCPPLTNEAIFYTNQNDEFGITTIQANQGIQISDGQTKLTFPAKAYCPSTLQEEQLAYYDWSTQIAAIESQGQVMVQLVGRQISEVIPTFKGQQLTRLPIGLTLLIPPKQLPKHWKKGDKLTVMMPNCVDFRHALMGGHLLLEKEQICPAILQQTTLVRTPKIAFGLTESGHLFICAIQGRTRTSVGATCQEVAQLLLEKGVSTALCFPPHAQTALLVNGELLTVAPYHSNYEENFHALPPQVPLASCVMVGWKGS